MTRNYLTYTIPRLPPKVKPFRRLISQIAASRRYNMPSIAIRRAIDAGLIDWEHDRQFVRAVVINERFRQWLFCEQRRMRAAARASARTGPGG